MKIKTAFFDLKNNAIFKKIFGLTILLYLSPAIGILVDLVFIRQFGAGGVLDVFRILMGVVILGNALISQQLFKFIVIPQLAKFKNENRESDGLLFANWFIFIVFIMTLPVLFVGLFYPDVALNYLAPGITSNLADQAIGLVRISAIGLIITTLTGALASVLNFYGNFWGQPLAQIILNGSVVISILIFGHDLNYNYEQFAVLQYSLIASYIGMSAVMMWLYCKIWKKVYTGSNISISGNLLMVIPLLLPQLILLGSEVFKPILINRTLSHFDAGSLAIYLLAFKLLMLSNLPVQGILTVIFPNMANQNTQDAPYLILKRFMSTSLKIFTGTSIFAFVFFLLSPFVIWIFSYFSNLDQNNQSLLLELYKLFLIFAPFGALGNYLIQMSYASGLRMLTIGYSLFNLGLLAWLLPYTISEQPHDVAIVFILVQSISFTMMGIILYFYLKSKIENI